MERRLTRENLAGVWAAIATPFDEHDHFDEDVFRENVRRLHKAGVHGVYTTDSDGEFYAIELAEFRRIVDVFADEAERLGLATQVGVTWPNTQGMLDRLRYAADRGILGAHVGHPFFMPMTPRSYAAFWADVQAAVPGWFGLVHYNTPRVHNTQRGSDYAVLQIAVPNLIGTKHVGSDVGEFMAVVTEAPQLSHFTGEHAFTPFVFLGARGIYSWFANFNPRATCWSGGISWSAAAGTKRGPASGACRRSRAPPASSTRMAICTASLAKHSPPHLIFWCRRIERGAPTWQYPIPRWRRSVARWRSRFQIYSGEEIRDRELCELDLA
jgi:4-hydroxy-tetrahydrodipicolinate synthase